MLPRKVQLIYSKVPILVLVKLYLQSKNVRQVRAVLCGYYGKGNGGDEALLATLLQMLPDHVTPVVLSGNPDETRDRYQVETCDRMSVSPLLKVLRHSDAFIWGGGSIAAPNKCI